MKKINFIKIAFALFFFLSSTVSVAQPPDGFSRGNLIFLGRNSDSSKSVWLSVTTAGFFKLEAQGNQLIDTWNMSRRGIHLSLSPIVSQGNGGTHFLINSRNNRKLDSENQQGGIIFPPLPPPIVTNPIPPFPQHPIVIPPGSPPSVTHPIQPSPGHPIVIPPGSPPSVSHPIQPSPGHPIVIPPGSPPSVSHPIQPTPGHPTVIPPGPKQPAQSASSKQPGRSLAIASQTVGLSTESESIGEISQQAPITEGRQFDQEKKWNIWSDNYYLDSRDGRNDLDAKGTMTNFVVGADRRIVTNLVLGAVLSSIKFTNSAFDGDLKNRTRGFNIGPYFAYSISPKWSANGSFTYGRWQNNNTLASLDSEYTTQVLHADLHATGLYHFGKYQLRPKPLISFTHFRNPAYQFNGFFRNIHFRVARPKESFNLNFVELRVEGLYTIETKSGSIIQPYIEPGIDYAFARPNDGQILTGNLDLASSAPVVETLTLGIRALVSRAFLIETSGSYLSFGQGGLHVWQLRLMASYSFG